MCTEYIKAHSIDLMFLTETWISETDTVVIGEIKLPGYSVINVPRISDHYGGGIGFVSRVELKLQLLPTGLTFTTFEHACFTNVSTAIPIYYFLIYRPPPSQDNGFKIPEFLREFDSFVDHVNSLGTKSVITGDFNIHVDNPSKSDASHFLTTIDNVGFLQYVYGSTHKNGHTLDLIIARPEDNLVSDCYVDALLSDHHVVCCKIRQKKCLTL